VRPKLRQCLELKLPPLRLGQAESDQAMRIAQPVAQVIVG
jgi:hypothetical protein